MKEEILSNLSVERREQQWKDTINSSSEILYIALNDLGEIIGFASGGKSRSTEYSYDGELYAIYILQEYQQQGIGKRLISHVANELRAQGYRSMIVWVLSDNPSIEAYKRLGAVAFDTKEIEIGGDNLMEEVLVWEDINEPSWRVS